MRITNIPNNSNPEPQWGIYPNLNISLPAINISENTEHKSYQYLILSEFFIPLERDGNTYLIPVRMQYIYKTVEDRNIKLNEAITDIITQTDEIKEKFIIPESSDPTSMIRIYKYIK